MKRIDILFFDATSGHRTAAYAIEKALLQADHDIAVRVVNLVDLLQPQPLLQMLAKFGVDIFNWGVRHEMAWFLRQQIGFFQMIQANVPHWAIQQVANFWRNDSPDMVVSVLPICNWLLERALHSINPDNPYIIIPVDFEEGKKNYWFDTRMNAYYINPTETLEQQAASIGIAPHHTLRVAGMPIDPLFYDSLAHNKNQALQDLGLNPAHPTVLVSFGGQGSVMVKRCAEKLCAVTTPINAIFLCGRHQQLVFDIEALDTPYLKAVLGYTVEAPAHYYLLADALIGKPGSMTITEAIITHTPLLAVESQSLALVQRGNEKWLRQSRVGKVITLAVLPTAVDEILSSEDVNDNLEREWHRGVFEIADILVHFLKTGVFQSA